MLRGSLVLEGILLVDASNAFNNLNRQVALHNIQAICPSLATILINTYRILDIEPDSSLFIDGETIYSCEVTTQGDPLAMYMYALATLPLIESLPNKAHQIWFADDAGSGGALTDPKVWWDSLLEKGLKYGYNPNAVKSYLLVKSNHLEEAKSVFGDNQINVTNETTSDPQSAQAITLKISADQR